MISGSGSRAHKTPTVIAKRYRVERELGRGGMATVYLCTDSQTQQQVAVKVLRPEVGSAVVFERFLREIEFASELDHPRIPKVLDSGRMGELPFYVMTFIQGESLRTRLDRAKQLPVEEAIHIACAVIEPMEYAHQRGIVHRDIKPGNILIAADGVYVLDFGIARAIVASATESLTSTGIAVGTPAYMSPEQALSDEDIDARSDIYSLGCVIYEMIAGDPPFVGATPQAVMARRFASTPPPLRETREGIPEHIEQAIAKALCRAPADRWASAKQFGDALAAPAPSSSEIAARARIDRRRCTYRRAAIAAAVVALGGSGVFAWLAANRDPVEQARASLGQWDFGAAESSLRRGLNENPDDPTLKLWLAQLLMLRGEPVALWKRLALQAADQSSQLRPPDAMRAAALAAFTSDTVDDLCKGFERLAARDEPASAKDFSSTLALAECLRSDRSIVPDSASPSRYRFRSSYHTIASLYEGLLARHTDNSAAYRFLMPRLETVLSTSKGVLILGTLRGDPDIRFVAWPSLAADTLAYVPQRLGGAGTAVLADDAQLTRVVSRNLEKLKDLASGWTRSSPDDPDGHETLARMLEASNKLEGPGPSAMGEIVVARTAARRNRQSDDETYLRQLRLASTHVRLLLKVNRFPAARALADSIIDWRPAVALSDSPQHLADDALIGLSALTGHVRRMNDLSQKYAEDYIIHLPAGEVRKLPADAGMDAISLATYSAFATEPDSITTIMRRLSERLAAVFPAGEVADVRAAIMTAPLSWAAPAIGPAPLASLGPSADLFARAARALTDKDVRRARSFADSLASRHAKRAPGELSMDAVLHDAWLRAATGDTAGSVRILDNALRGLSRMQPNLFVNFSLPTAFVRAMILRSELAALANDPASAGKWGGAAYDLWGGGDPEVRKAVAPWQHGR